MPRQPEPVVCGHPERPHRALGMCTACYFVHWRKTTAERRQWERERIARRLAELARIAS